MQYIKEGVDRRFKVWARVMRYECINSQAMPEPPGHHHVGAISCGRDGQFDGGSMPLAARSGGGSDCQPVDESTLLTMLGRRSGFVIRCWMSPVMPVTILVSTSPLRFEGTW